MGSELQLDLEVTIHLQFLHLLLLCLAGTMRRPRGTVGEVVPMSSTEGSRAGADACHPPRADPGGPGGDAQGGGDGVTSLGDFSRGTDRFENPKRAICYTFCANFSILAPTGMLQHITVR